MPLNSPSQLSRSRTISAPPSHWAGEVGGADMAELLLDAGADADAPSGDGRPIERALHPGPCKPNAADGVIAGFKRGGVFTPGVPPIGQGGPRRGVIPG